MTDGARRPAFGSRLAAGQWLAASAVLAHALLARFEPGAPWAVWLGVAALAGWLLRTDPLPHVAAGRAVPGALRSALGLGVGVGLLRLALGATRPEGFAAFAPWIGLAAILVLDATALGRLGRVVGVEWTKTRRSVLFKAALVATALVTLLSALWYEPLQNACGWTRAARTFARGTWVAEVFALVLGATAVSGEATGGTLKMMLPHAYRRSDWIVGKTAVLLLVSLLLFAVAGAIAVVDAQVTEGLGDVMNPPVFGLGPESGGVFLEEGAMRGHGIEVLGVTLGALLATGLVGVVLSSVFDGVVPSLCAAFLAFAGLKFSDVLLGLPTERLKDVYAWYPGHLRETFEKLSRAYSAGWDAPLGGEGLHLCLLTGATALVVSIRAFSRRDLHA